MAEGNKQLNKSIRLFLGAAGKKYAIEHAYVFGSYTKGTATRWSDIDLALISRDFSLDLSQDRLFLMKLAAAIDDRIEPILYRPADFHHNDPLVHEIQKTGVKIF